MCDNNGSLPFLEQSFGRISRRCSIECELEKKSLSPTLADLWEIGLAAVRISSRLDHRYIAILYFYVKSPDALDAP